MKTLSTLMLPLLLLTACNSKPTEKSNNTVYNLATELGADEYGMKQYVMAFLKKGPNRSQDSIEAAALQRAHMDNIQKMADEGVLVVAGPFLDDGDIRGIYLFNVTSIEEAEALTRTDPAIQAGRLSLELHPWYGSAALMKVNEWHELLSSKKF